MKHVVEYKLHAGQIPYFIQDGGHFPNNGKLIGLTHDDVDCYVPSEPELVTFAAKADFQTYVAALTLSSIDGSELTEQQKLDLAEAWWNARK